RARLGGCYHDGSLRHPGTQPRNGLYEGAYAYRVEVADVDAVGRVIDTAVDAGADDVGRATFTLSEATREDLREIAIEDAMVNAEREAE
ncbi:SIMPL domain-containing protein, partial [Aeromonas schubertii]|uniref:SIMPL domain-containing protein n=1 Tax=Aeromonas schubertii TaxID=652 RepID=UPI0038B63B82